MVYTHSSFGVVRILRREGGTDSGGGFGDGDLSCAPFTGTTCTSFCEVRAAYNQLECTYSASLPYYMKCYDAFSIQPLNSLRVSFPSQTGTTAIDPTIPKLSIGNISSCLRMINSHENIFNSHQTKMLRRSV